MIKFRTWISAARPRTLPLSIAGIMVGTALALKTGYFEANIFVLALLTTLGLQILSNFANDYGDGIKGTDNHERVGPMRALQSGIITHHEMKKGMVVASILTLIFAVLLIYEAFGADNFGYSILFFLLGLASIVAAIKYTVGNSAYGYRGLGDLFVFLFFGLLSVLGSFFLYGQFISFSAVFPAITVGLLSTAVLNLNNMRDRSSDERAGKHTLAVKLGEHRVKFYHYTLIVVAFLAILVYLLVNQAVFQWFSLLAFIPLALHLKTVYKNNNPTLLDPELKKVALSTVLFALLFLGLALFP